MTAVIVIEAVVIVLLLVLVAGLLKSHAEILRQLHRLGGDREGRPTPDAAAAHMETAPTSEISGVDPDGVPRVISLAHERGHTLLAFLSSGCASCQVFWEELSQDPDLPTDDTRLVVVTKGPAGESPARIAELAPGETAVVMSDDMWDLFRVPMTPYFLMVDGDGRILGEGSAASWRQLLRLFRRSLADTRHPARLDTDDRERFTDSQLSGSGIDPGDPALYDNPLDT